MSDITEELLAADARRWNASQSRPPALRPAVGKAIATSRNGRRARVALAATLVAAMSALFPLTHAFVPSGNAGRSLATKAAISSSASQEVVNQLSARARSIAVTNNDPRATAAAVHTEFGRAQDLVGSQDASSFPAPDTDVWVLSLQGTFDCAQCKSTDSASTPIGTHIIVILDAQTLETYEFEVSSESVDLSALGAPFRLAM